MISMQEGSDPAVVAEKQPKLSNREIQAGELLPWLLLWMAAPAPLWIALTMFWWMGK